MGEAEHVPHGDVGVGDRSVRLGPGRQALVVGLALRHVVTSGEAFVVRGRRHPQVLHREPGATSDAGPEREQGRRVGGQQLVASRLPQTIRLGFVDDPPGASLGCIDHVGCLLLGLKPSRHGPEGVVERIVRPRFVDLDVDSVRRVVRTVDFHIEASTEQVLVDRRGHLGADERGVG